VLEFKTYPKIDGFLADKSFAKYFEETCLRVGWDSYSTDDDFQIQHDIIKLSDCIKSVSLSGWNPPPGYRKVQGDLFYIEIVTAAEGSFHVTATYGGFFVSKISRNNFDPSPAAKPSFFHELHDTIYDHSSSYRQIWTQYLALHLSRKESLQKETITENAEVVKDIVEFADEDVLSENALSTQQPLAPLTSLYLGGKIEKLLPSCKWVLPTDFSITSKGGGGHSNVSAISSHGHANGNLHSNSGNGLLANGHSHPHNHSHVNGSKSGNITDHNLAKHTFDMARLHEELSNTYGLDMPSSPRYGYEKYFYYTVLI